MTVGAIGTSGASFGAIGAGSSFIDNSATDPGNSYQAVVGGLVELASLSDASNLEINNGGTIALSNPAASTGALFQDLTAGDVLELPGTSVSNVSFTTNGLTVTTGGPGGGTYAFTNVSYFGTPLSGFTATHDSTTGLEAITFTSPDVFSDQVAASSGPLAGSYLWSDPNNWSAGVPGDGATVTADGSGFDDIASLSLASLNVTTGLSYVVANSLTVGTVTASASTALFADSGNAPGPVTVTVGAIDTSGTSYGAIGAGSSFIDNSATDPGNSYQAVVGGLVELASLSDASNLEINNGGTIALSNPAASTGALFQDLTAGDVLELPGTSVSNVSFTTNGLTVTTGGPGGGTYAFTNVSYFGTPLSGFTATHDTTTGLEAITFTSPDVFTDTGCGEQRSVGRFLPVERSEQLECRRAVGRRHGHRRRFRFRRHCLTEPGEPERDVWPVVCGREFADRGHGHGQRRLDYAVCRFRQCARSGHGDGRRYWHIRDQLRCDWRRQQLHRQQRHRPGELLSGGGGRPGRACFAIRCVQPADQQRRHDRAEQPGREHRGAVRGPDRRRRAGTAGHLGQQRQLHDERPDGDDRRTWRWHLRLHQCQLFRHPTQRLHRHARRHHRARGDHLHQPGRIHRHRVAASSGPLAGSYLWSDPNNWSAGVPSDGATVTADGSGFDDIASLSLASLNVTSGQFVCDGEFADRGHGHGQRRLDYAVCRFRQCARSGHGDGRRY